ncbi:DUF192 domain-containing protein [Synechocystis sp. LKSZ1]|uniref:DUF192 domain-containing protein n=1 Tax=Synechocystis sp. LKSZ1 TaxID=3144951 RepID=UPI00336C2D66
MLTAWSRPWLYLLIASFLLSSCWSVLSEDNPALSGQGQQLPVTAQLPVAGQVIDLEVAQTPEQQAKGLMFREQLAPNRGMLFAFSPPRVARFWMKNTLIDLDMIFVYQGRIVMILDRVPPCRQDPCPVYGPWAEVDQVIELAAGQAEHLGLKVGDSLTVRAVSSPKP